MKEQIKNIIESYCEGINHLEFNIADLDKMAEEILALQLQQTGVSGSVLKPQLCKDCNNFKEPKLTSKICGDCFFYDNNQQSNFIHKFK
jgi:hypothetical protein